MRRIMIAALMGAALMIPAGFAQAADAPASAPAAAAHVEKIGIVDLEALIATSKAGKSVKGQIEKQRDTFRAQLSKIEKELMDDGKKLQDDIANKNTAEFAEKNKAFEVKKSSYQKQAQEKGLALDRGANEAVIEIKKAIQKVVAGIAEKDHYTIVLTRDNVVIAENEKDITSQVMGQLDKELPDVKLTLPTIKETAPAAAPAAAKK